MAGPADLPFSGVQAVVQGVDKYVRDINRLNSANASMDKALMSLYSLQTKTGKSAQEIVQSFQREEEATKRLADAQGTMAMRSALLTQKMEEEAEAARKVNQAMTIAGAAMMAFGAVTAKALAPTVQLAARVETLGVVVDQLSGLTGKTPGDMRELEKSLQSTGITMQASRSSIARMYQAEIDLAFATDLAREAQNAAVIANINSSDAFENLIYGIQSGNVRILRTMGLQVSFADAYKRTAAELGKNTMELTQYEKVQARTQEVIRAGATITGAYEAAMTTAGKKVLTLQRYTEEAGRAFGDTFLPEYGAAVDLITKSLKWWIGLSDAEQAFASSAATGTVATIAMTGALMVLKAQLPALIAMVKSMLALLIANPWIIAAAAIGLVVTALVALHKEAKIQHETQVQTAKDYAQMGKTMKEYRTDVIAAYQDEGKAVFESAAARRKYIWAATTSAEMGQRQRNSVVMLSEAELAETWILARYGDERQESVKSMRQATDALGLLAIQESVAADKARGLAQELWDTTKASQNMWTNLTPDLSGLISGWLEAINFVQNGGAELQAALEQVWMGVQTGAISPEAGKNLLTSALPAAAIAQAAAETGATTGPAFQKAFTDAMLAGGATTIEAAEAFRNIGKAGADGIVSGVTEQLQVAMGTGMVIPEGMGASISNQLRMQIGGMGEATDLFSYLGIPTEVDLSAVDNEFVEIGQRVDNIDNKMRGWNGMETESTHTVHVEFEGGVIPGAQHGGNWIVGGRGGIDTNLVMFRATRGERVTVTPASQVANTYNQQQTNRTVNIGQQSINSRDDRVWFDKQMRDWLGG